MHDPPHVQRDMALNRQNSRFSSLRVFRFPSKSEQLPPPPPPKDPYYLSNRSLASLLPESIPGTPISSEHAHRPSFAPYQSTMSLVSSPVSPTSVSSAPRMPKRERSIFRFGKRSPKSPSHGSISPKSPAMEDGASQPRAEDGGISMPWNFQHHTHVDEGLGGLPPSWSALLADAGFTEEEIATIRARRGVTHPTSQESLTDRSPLQPLHPPVLTRPTPRSTSLPRQFPDPNAHPSSHRIPHPFAHAISESASVRKNSTDSKFSDPSCSMLDISQEVEVTHPHTQNNLGNSHGKKTSLSSLRSSQHTRSRTSSSESDSDLAAPQLRPMSPPKRTMHVVNGAPSPGLNSPPPAYDPTERTIVVSDSKSPSGPSLPNPHPPPTPEKDKPSFANTTNSKTVLGSKPQVKKLTTLPPRLSLYDNSGDLSSWSEALLSAIPSEISSSTSHSPEFILGQSARTPAIPFPKSPFSSPESEIPSARSGHKRDASGRYVTSIILNEYDEDDKSSNPPHTARSPLWDELMGMVQESSPASYAPALNESMSPTLPSSPSQGERRFHIDAHFDPDGEEEENENDDKLVPIEQKEQGSNRDSGTSLVSTTTVTAATIVHNASVAKRATANFFDPLHVKDDEERKAGSSIISSTLRSNSNLDSPLSSNFSGSSGSGSSSLPSQDHQTQYVEVEVRSASPSPVYSHFPDSPPLPSKTDFIRGHSLSRSGTFGIPEIGNPDSLNKRQTTVVDCTAPSTPMTPNQQTPEQRYRGWLSEVVAPLEEFIDHHTDPREHYVDLQEVAEGESGSVYAARVVDAHKLTLPAKTSFNSGDEDGENFVAIKNVPILPSGSPKLNDLQRELTLMKGVRHEFVLGMDALYVDLVEDSLWIRMELMEKSLADVIECGFMIQERMIARFSSDALSALEYLHGQGIAHRDLRSDNLLLNTAGILKIADFSNAVRVTADSPVRSDVVGVIYWQAPEMRTGPYNALQVDVWSLGATVWEMAQAKPPFADAQDPRQIGDQWPPLSQPEIYSRSFHEFLRLCSQPASSRPDPGILSDTAFIRNACGRQVIIQLLSQCRAIEERGLQEAVDS